MSLTNITEGEMIDLARVMSKLNYNGQTLVLGAGQFSSRPGPRAFRSGFEARKRPERGK